MVKPRASSRLAERTPVSNSGEVMGAMWLTSPPPSISRDPLEIARGHVIGQPDAVSGKPEDMALRRHLRRCDPQDHGFAAAGANGGRCLRIGREVDVMALHRLQPLGED